MAALVTPVPGELASVTALGGGPFTLAAVRGLLGGEFTLIPVWRRAGVYRVLVRQDQSGLDFNALATVITGPRVWVQGPAVVLHPSDSLEGDP